MPSGPPAAAPLRTPEPESWAEAIDASMAPAPMNRHERRRLDALARKAQRQAA